MPKKILVTGANGQLGSELQVLAKAQNKDTFIFTDKETLDLSSKDSIIEYFKDKDFDVIINCAAYTAVDNAEDDEETAYAINHKAVEVLARIAKSKDIKLIHISTDYVFDGKNFKPYVEDDPTHPQSIYGASKFAGEEALVSVNPDNAIIIRTSWVYSSFGNNFVKTMLRLGKERDELGVIFDQIGTPTYARDLAQAIIHIIQHSKLPRQEMPLGCNTQNSVMVYYYSNEGACSWYDFAKAIFEISGIQCEVTPIETVEYPTPAARPSYSLLNKSKIKKEYNITIPYWRDSLKECLEKMGERK